MKATEILNKLQSVFLSEEVSEVVEETQEVEVETKSEEVNEEVIAEELSEEVTEEVTEEVKEEATELAEEAEEGKEEVQEEVVKVEFATKEDLSSLKSEMLEILSTLEEIRKEYKKDGWNFVRERKDVQVYEKEVGERISFKGVGIIEGTPEKLIGIPHVAESLAHCRRATSPATPPATCSRGYLPPATCGRLMLLLVRRTTCRTSAAALLSRSTTRRCCSRVAQVSFLDARG